VELAEKQTPVLILGGGVAGLAAARELARRGVACVLAEREPVLGGRARGFACKATTACARCGACRVGDLLAELAARPEAELFTCAGAVAARRDRGRWQVELAPQPGEGAEPFPARALGERLALTCRAVILAVGYSPFDPRAKSRFGYGRVPGVISALELEAMLAQDTLAGPRGEPPRRVAFIQCVGSRDQSLGHLYCSRVCCGYALRMAGRIRHTWPESEVSFFHMDLQTYGRAWEEALPELRRQVHLVRAMPGEVTRGEDDTPQVVYSDPAGRHHREPFDLVVLSVGLRPPKAASALAEMFGLEPGPDGFLQDGPEVFVAGCAQGPRGIVESMDHAARAAAAALRLLDSGREAAHG